MSAVPVIKRCILERHDFSILMTTTRMPPLEIIKSRLPTGVICQVMPFDTPAAIDSFLSHWKPNAIMLMESELWPNLIMCASRHGIPLALLNARMSTKSFKHWSGPVARPLLSLMLSKFSLISPLSTTQAIHFQLLHASPSIINFPGDLKFAVGELGISNEDTKNVEDLRIQLGHRRIWMASSIHRGEEEVMLGVHKALIQRHPSLVLIIVPRHPWNGQEIAIKVHQEGLSVALRSRNEQLMPGVNVYVADTLGELRCLYSLAPIAVIGGSFLPGLAGHNISEAAAVGCAVLTGFHVGHFSHMIMSMQRLNPLSVLQVLGKTQLEEAISELLVDAKALEARRVAAKQVSHDLSSGVVVNTWNLLKFHVFRHAPF